MIVIRTAVDRIIILIGTASAILKYSVAPMLKRTIQDVLAILIGNVADMIDIRKIHTASAIKTWTVAPEIIGPPIQ